MKKFGVLTTLVLVFILPLKTFACACCAEKGFHSSETLKLDQYLTEEIDKLVPATATVYTDAGYPDSVVGLGSESTGFRVESPFGNGIWNYQLDDEKENKGMISLIKSSSARRLMVDQDPTSDTNTVLLYKEFTFSGKVQNVTGFLQTGESYDMRYELILQGKGNMCTSADDFRSYILKIRGLKANYDLFGRLSVSEAKALQSQGDSSGTVVPARNQ